MLPAARLSLLSPHTRLAGWRCCVAFGVPPAFATEVKAAGVGGESFSPPICAPLPLFHGLTQHARHFCLACHPFAGRCRGTPWTPRAVGGASMLLLWGKGGVPQTLDLRQSTGPSTMTPALSSLSWSRPQWGPQWTFPVVPSVLLGDPHEYLHARLIHWNPSLPREICFWDCLTTRISHHPPCQSIACDQFMASMMAGAAIGAAQAMATTKGASNGNEMAKACLGNHRMPTRQGGTARRIQSLWCKGTKGTWYTG